MLICGGKALVEDVGTLMGGAKGLVGVVGPLVCTGGSGDEAP